MTIDIDSMFVDVNGWLPVNNKLEDSKIGWVINTMIAKYGDSDDLYNEVLCRSLKLCAELNSSNSLTGDEGIKLEKLGSLTTSYYNTTDSDTWSDWIKNKLPEYCLIIGWQFPHKPIGIYISPCEDIDPLEDCEFTM